MLGKRKQLGFEKARHKGGEIDIEAWVKLVPAACCKSLRQEKHWSPMGWIEENMKSTHIRQIVSQAISLGAFPLFSYFFKNLLYFKKFHRIMIEIFSLNLGRDVPIVHRVIEVRSCRDLY
ncbi:hypothetical protein Golax_003256, partial [Gossypium laxum]|nr:hypothetical protein [Gossypium laxum]